MSCRRLDDLENVLPGWACCQCSTYNGYQRSQCKACGHPHCYPSELGELMPIYGPDGEIQDQYDPRTRTIAKRSASPS